MSNVNIHNIARRPKDAATPAELWQYYDTRSRQFLMSGFCWDGKIEWVPGFAGTAVQTFFTAGPARWASYFVLPAHRGKGVMRALATDTKHPIITLEDCELSPILTRYGAPHLVVGAGILDSVEYDLIEEFYADRRTNRSKAFLMNHIDEGLAIMAWRGASLQARRAYCLHPLLQNDEDLDENFARVARAVETLPDGAMTMALALEYRSVANGYLSDSVMPVNGIRLSPIYEVNEMLVADKVQNRKDFELHFKRQDSIKPHGFIDPAYWCHAANHARLEIYFQEWLNRLKVSPEVYASFVAQLPGQRTVQLEIPVTAE